MKAPKITIITLLMVAATTMQSVTANPSPSVQSYSAQDRLHFIPNQGQWDDRALYQTNCGNHTTWFASDGAHHQFIRSGSDPFSDLVPRSTGGLIPSSQSAVLDDSQLEEGKPAKSYLLKQLFLNANPNPMVIPENKQTYYVNYFLGNDSTKWRPNVPTFNSIVYSGVYPGIDVRYFGDGERLNYDFILTPGSDLLQVRVKYEGADSLWIDVSGDLVIETPVGQFKEQRLFAYQGMQSEATALAARYILIDKTTYGFELLAQPNPFLAVVVDPVLIYSTYLGGTFEENWVEHYGNHLAVDGSGNVYLTGSTWSTDFPTLNAYDSSAYGQDAFVTKLSASGNSLVYSTYLGGSGEYDIGHGIAIDQSSNVYIVGKTRSADFPTLNAFDSMIDEFEGADAFVTKLSSSGNSLIYSTYLGSGDLDDAFAIAVDTAGSSYVTGFTGYSDFPIVNAFDSTWDDPQDVFVTKFSPNGSSLVYSTFLGGSFAETGLGIVVDGLGSAYVTGYTNSADFPTISAFDNTIVDTSYDAFVTKFSPAGNSLLYSTFLGGSGYEVGTGIAVDGSRNAYVTGSTASSDFPTQNAFDNTLNSSNGAGFVSKLSATGNSLGYSTFLEGSDGAGCFGIAVDRSGNAYVSGVTTSSDFPTQTAYDTTFNGGFDAFVTKFTFLGTSLAFSTYLGGSGDDRYSGIGVDNIGNTYIAGTTSSANFPTRNAYDSTYNVFQDVFITKFSEACCVPPIRGNVNGSTGDAVNVVDITYLVAYLFQGGAAPPCKDEADVNGNGTVNVVDLTFLVQRLFQGGPPPAACP